MEVSYKALNKEGKNLKIRYNIISVVVYIIGIVLIAQLFNLQIIQGAEYREKSNTRLTRESTIRAARGDILDSSGNKLATTKMGYLLQLYRTKIDNDTLNNTLLKITETLEKNGDSYIDKLPIKIDPFDFTYTSQESQENWKKNNNIDKDKTAEECFYILKEKYKINNEDLIQARKIMALRYEITRNGYSSIRPIEIASSISEKSMHEFTEQGQDYPGVSIIEIPIRSYPEGSLASHVLGYIGRISEEEYNKNKETYTLNDIIGRTGIEYTFEKYLKGKDGIKQIDMSVEGTITEESVVEEAIGGCDVVLTIDANLQKVTEEALKNNIQKIANGGFTGSSRDTNAGSAVVMNVKTGEVLAIASYPDYEPQLFADGISSQKYQEYISEEAHSPLFNRAISSTSPPGSTFKMVTAIAALETGVVTTTEKINDVGIYKYYNERYKCWIYSSYGGGHGYLNVSEAIKHSCNYFFYEMGNRLGIDRLSSYAKYLGLGSKTGIELQGEEKGTVSSKETSKSKGETFQGGNTLQAAIGQHDNSFTPIQMAKYIAMIVNGGKQIDVTIIKSILDKNLNEISKDEINNYLTQKLGIRKDIKQEEELFKEENVKAILEGMRGVTSESGGTAYQYFKNFDIEIGGKTGSAQTGIAGRTNGWFVGFAPYNDPEIAVVVMVENAGSGGYTAEAARDIIAEYFGMNSNRVTENMNAIPETQIQN